MKKLSYLLLIIIQSACFTLNAQWIKLNGPYGGDVKCFAQHLNNQFIVVGNAGIYRSGTINGWELIKQNSQNTNFKTLTIAGGNVVAGSDNGIFISADNGTTWNSSNTGLTNLNINVLFSNGTTLVAGTEGGGAFISPDNGLTWNPANNGLTGPVITSIIANGTNVFVGTRGNGVFMTSNNGSSWTTVSNGLTNLNINTLVQVGTNIFAGSDAGLFKSSTLTSINWAATGLQGIKVNSLAANGSNIYAGTINGMYFSQIGGTSWNAINAGLPVQYINAVYSQNLNLIACTGGGGLFNSANNGSSWSPMNNELNGFRINAIAFNNGKAFAGTSNGGAFLSADDGQTWMHINNTSQYNAVNSIIINSGKVFLGTGNGIYQSDDNGATWNQTNNGLANTQINCLLGISGYIFAGTNGGVFLSVDNGQTWQVSGTGIPAVQILSIHEVAGNIYVGTNGNGVFKSTDNGQTWVSLNPQQQNLVVVAIGSINNKLFASTSISGVYQLYSSIDNGTTWLTENTVPNSMIKGFFVTNNAIFAATSGNGIYVSKDDGQTWNHVNHGLVGNNFSTFGFNSDHLYVGGNLNGMWKRPVAQMFLPGPANQPSGDSIVCQGQLAAKYFVAQVPNADQYVWNLQPQNAGNIFFASNDTILINWNQLFTGSAQLTVKGVNQFGEGLVSPPLNIDVQQGAIITGTVSYSGGNFNAGDAMVKLIKKSTFGRHRVVDSTITGTNGSFVLNNFPPGLYYIRVLVLNHDAYPQVRHTFFNNAHKWFNATVIDAPCGYDTTLSIQMFELQANGFNGPGHMKGKVRKRNFTGGKAEGEPIPGAEIYVELEPDDEPVANFTTDSTGSYDIVGVQNGTYSIHVDIPGYPMIETYTVTITGSDSAYTNLNFYVDTTSSDAGIYITTVSNINNIESGKIDCEIYPIPAKNELYLNTKEDISYEIADISGQVILKGNNSVNSKLDIGNILPGTYFLKIFDKEKHAVYKIIKL